uniref:Uncharacterized protein n=1 Tax=Magallana gigas TaxID=29159 RepID=K1QLC2_MAGGI
MGGTIKRESIHRDPALPLRILTLLSPRTFCCNLLWDSSLQLVVVDVADGSRVILSTSPSLSICDVCSSIEPELHTMSLLAHSEL